MNISLGFTAALATFVIMYILMLSLQKYRTYIALSAAVLFIVMGHLGLFEMNFLSALKAIDYNVILMISGTMGLVTLFIESRMPTRLSEILITKVPDVRWAVTVLSIFSGVISAFIDNVATVLMVAPVGLAISKKLKLSPVPVLIAISVSSNLQGAATLVGDTTSILLGSRADMNFFEFFWMHGRPGIFWGVELGAAASILVLLWIFRKENQKISAEVETEVKDLFPTYLMLGVIVLLICASFIPRPETPVLLTLYNLRSGLICVALCVIGIIRDCIRNQNASAVKKVIGDIDRDTILMLVGLFIVIEGITSAGVIDAISGIFYKISGNNTFLFYTILVAFSVAFSAFIDNIPYVATMLPVVAGISSLMGAEPYVFYFGLLTGATLGGNLTPIGASANITTIGILRKNGYEVKNSDFLRIGIPFTLTAVLVGYVYIWLVWGH
ncbi:MAG: arsenic transporter [Clostridiales bacterium]|nr:arsenic transporter [Clostridiales bacterium]